MNDRFLQSKKRAMPGIARFILLTIEITDLLCSRRMTELADRLILDLTDTFTGNTENLTDFF